MASLTGLTINGVDQLILGLLVPVGSLGLYTVAASASSPLPYVVASLGMVGLPTVAALPGQAKAAATWKALRRAAYLLAVLAPACAALIPLAVPAAYGGHYSAAVIPAELLLIGAVFTALTAVADDLLRAHGNPGFVSISQGAGGAVTIVGTLLLARRSLTEVALVSSLGFAVAFVLALIRLWIATRRTSHTGATSATARRHRVGRPRSLRLSQPIAIPDRFPAEFRRSRTTVSAGTSKSMTHPHPMTAFAPIRQGPMMTALLAIQAPRSIMISRSMVGRFTCAADPSR